MNNLVPPDPQKDLRAIGHLAAEAFSNGQYEDAYCDNYIGNSHYDWDVSRLIKDQEKLVHHWGVWGYQMRLESVQLKVAGIGAVVTHPDYRKQGLMHSAARESFDAMKKAGYDLSILRGRHYVKMGYARAWNYVTYRVKLEEFPELGLSKSHQPLRADQIGEMDAFYNQTHANFTGTAVRPTYRRRHPDDIGVNAWFDEQGRLTGYIRALPSEENPKVLQCLEAAGDPREGLAVLADLYRNGSYDNLTFFTLPHDHPVLQQLRKGACIVEDRYFDITGWRVRIINLNSTLEKLLPLFETRLAASHFADWHGSLFLDAGEQTAMLNFNRGKVELSSADSSPHSLRGGADIARFLIGSDEPDEIIRQAEMECKGLARPLVQVMFPNLHPMMSHWDEY